MHLWKIYAGQPSSTLCAEVKIANGSAYTDFQKAFDTLFGRSPESVVAHRGFPVYCIDKLLTSGWAQILLNGAMG